MSNPTDKARELAELIRQWTPGEGYPSTSNPVFTFDHSRAEATALIDAALKTARLEAIEECKAAVIDLQTCAPRNERENFGYMNGINEATDALDALKEAKP